MLSATREQLYKLAQLRTIAKSHPSAAPSIDPTTITGIILAGGQGSRLFPLTQSRCKPALLLGGKYRLIDVPLSNSLNAGIPKIFVLTQFLARSLHRHIFKTYPQDAFFPGSIEVLSAEQRPGKSDWFQGTADAVRQNIEYLLETPSEFFLVLSGDQLYRLDFDKLLQCAAQQKDVDVWVATLAISEKEASRMGVMKINEDNHIVDFYEKPNSKELIDRMRIPQSVLKNMGLESTEGKEFLGSMGIYLFRRSALFSLLAEDTRDDFGKHLIPTQVKKGKIAAFVHEGYWEDIGTIESFYTANLALNKENPPFTCHNEFSPIFTTSNHLPGPRFGKSTIFSSTICDGSIIDAAEVSNSILGERTVVKRRTIIKDSYIMGNDFYSRQEDSSATFVMTRTPITPAIGEDCLIKKCIIDKNVSIGNRVQLVNKNNVLNYDSESLYVRDGIIVVPGGTSLPDDFVF